LVKGKSITEALKISGKAIAEALGRFPLSKAYCAVLGQELRRSISNIAIWD
jgi:nitrogen fixation NifU-like protein